MLLVLIATHLWLHHRLRRHPPVAAHFRTDAGAGNFAEFIAQQLQRSGAPADAVCFGNSPPHPP
jgi:hypothetical protein